MRSLPEDIADRRGCVIVDATLYHRRPQAIMELQRYLIIRDVETKWISNEVILTGLCEYFDPVEEGMIFPEYRVTFRDDTVLSIGEHYV